MEHLGRSSTEKQPAAANHPPRTRKPLRPLQWKILNRGSEPVWQEATDVKAALDRALPTDEQRAVAPRLALGWQGQRAPALTEGDEAVPVPLRDADHPRGLDEMGRELLGLAGAIESRASAAVSARDAHRLRSLCAELVGHCQHDVTRIRREFLWTEVR
jgi:hypothetical protein